MPKVSVVMPVFNTAKFLPEAIESILNQTFKDFEFVIIDDGSTDESRQIIQAYADKDARIKAYQNKQNMWISYTRNRLINLTKTNFIAPQDSDDVSLPHRLEKEFNFLSTNPQYAVVSGDIIIIDEDWKEIWYRKYRDQIDKTILKKSPIAQSASMFDKQAFLKVWWYDDNLCCWEDYDLWLRLYTQWYKIKNLNDFLIKYRIRSGQSKTQVKKALKTTINIQKKAFTQYGLKPSISDKVFRYIENLLFFLPDRIILELFKKLEYRK